MNVIDANCWAEYVVDLIEGTEGWGSGIFEFAEANGGFLIDDGGLIRNQYVSVLQPVAEEIYHSWFERETIGGRIELVDVSGKDNYFNELSALGVPKGEHVYFRVSIHGGANYIFSCDCDFFDPTKKKAGEKAKAAAYKSRSSPVVRYMRRTHGVVIAHPVEHLKACG